MGNDKEKQGGKCCGTCCDYRRAVIILAVINIILFSVGLIPPSSERDNGGDDDMYNDDGGIYGKVQTQLIIYSAISIVMEILSIAGAIMYNKWMVGVPVIWAAVGFIYFIVFTQIAAEGWSIALYAVNYISRGLITCLWIYPSVFLFKEISSGVMSAETYKREEQSCCCV
mmetsp:Transcript_57414/g.69086  ORF Transcript_57414/g.69086 Transcript_57414/m.69086 type:complete len:170 (-) Transcript_57414:180-689(-)|eukprot:CAMPEP_0194368196 /NCGR_PEP_ID=MMETSP0174-20130528/16439_1 /TAXON_ID=216777 /ORGANISM="Proboscia alata, Strain PI-D3" /LENGTH=169 /DNA_ID=CAMNT_0039144453 /DNA_START=84 /DNA_END=593 /DNA_ORIENTATION=-